jgi:4-hydroxy-3-polyprenylbenzoate decarboxylase
LKQIVLGITGASGAAYAVRVAQLMHAAGVHLHVVASPYGRQVMAEELGIRQLTPLALTGQERANVTIYNHLDLGALISSGSFLTHGMVVCPCSSNTVAALAAGLADNLITRAAVVTLKEQRRLVIVPREMPLHTIELENLLRLSRSGVVVCPASPGFYNRPKTVDELVDFVAGRVLDLLGVPHPLKIRWNPDGPPQGDAPAGGVGSHGE